MKQDRTILLTNLNLYNIKKKGKLNAWLAVIHFSFPEKDTYPEAEGCHDVNYSSKLWVRGACEDRIRLQIRMRTVSTAIRICRNGLYLR